MTTGTGLTHTCPGGCGALVAHTRYACRGCWSALPGWIRSAIGSAYRKRDWPRHRAAMRLASDFYAARSTPSEG